ncbi:hypothetical protein Golomagni_04238, partial [Golovinomyces magnicellulatus]
MEMISLNLDNLSIEMSSGIEEKIETVEDFPPLPSTHSSTQMIYVKKPPNSFEEISSQTKGNIWATRAASSNGRTPDVTPR